ncbi:MAG: low affinity potassium transporter [Thelocarpon superellum]|nr:MAG: low affinity potassium transporter [Thelocarpon superellum]
MFGPWLDTFEWVRDKLPSGVARPRLNFLVIHYIYILILMFVSSVMIYPNQGIRYIDALFFSAGSVTQSGLNSVDVNKLTTYQQFIIYLVPMISSPIFINGFVVFVRLYWFEKSFRDIVRGARSYRRTRSRARTETKDRQETGREERGVNGRIIAVLHQRRNSNQVDLANPDDKAPVDGANGPPAGGETPQREETGPLHHRDITFADQSIPNIAARAVADFPAHQTAEPHIAFVEKQRHPKDKGVLRIPGPRDFDRGDIPEPVEDEGEGEGEGEGKGDENHARDLGASTDEARHAHSRANDSLELNDDDHVLKAGGRLGGAEGGPSVGQHFPRLRLRRPGRIRRASSLASGLSDLQSSLRTRASSFLRTSPADDPIPYLSWTPTVGRNSTFLGLTEDQREELGGVEYRALKTLTLILMLYYVGVHVLGVVILLPWIVRSAQYGAVLDAVSQSRIWWGFFTPASLFNDVGFTLTPDSMISFQLAVLPLFLGSILIVIGNTGFPCMLRFVIWLASLVTPRDGAVWEELRFLLDHPRRCFTLLFPSQATWWLFWILVLLNGLDLIFFVVLDLNDPTVTSLPPGFRVLDGIFQATSTRTAGTACVNLSLLHPAIQVSYLIMMYISVFPIAISIRRTNVYEEQSLGVYAPTDDEHGEEGQEPSYVAAHLRRQLSFDLWYIFLGMFVIAIAEGPRIQDPNDPSFTLFNVLFEIVSAYGTVGLSLGYPGINASFSAEFTTVSKLVIVAMMIRGRHRGLPYALDRAILLPSQSLQQKEEDDLRRRMQRRASNLSVADPAAGHDARPASGHRPHRHGAAARPSSEKEH